MSGAPGAGKPRIEAEAPRSDHVTPASVLGSWRAKSLGPGAREAKGKRRTEGAMRRFLDPDGECGGRGGFPVCSE